MAVLPSIAFLDDESQVLSGLKRVLRSKANDWDMSFYDQPREALGVFLKNPPTVAVLDIRMPEITGIDIAREIRSAGFGTVCIILSGSTEFDLAISSINDGDVFRYYVKPCDTADLIDGIEAALAKRGRRRRDDLADGGEPSLNTGTELTSAALDMIPYGVIVTDQSGHVFFTNSLAAGLLAEADGLMLDQSGICRASETTQTQRLHAAIREAFEQKSATALTIEGHPEAPLHVTVEPYEGQGGEARDLIYLFVFKDGLTPNPDPRLLISMFDLTVSESRLASALTKGLSLDEAAQECGITKSSARTYLKNIFGKLGVSRQAELVRKILLSLASGS